jgi:hypothetical protein
MKPLALFTLAQDEIDLLPVWLRWHQRYAPDADIYILDHESRGDAADYFSCLPVTVQRIPVYHGWSFDYDWLTRTVEDFTSFLLRSYRAVAFCEVDELLWPWTETYPTLGAVAHAEPAAFVRAQGLCPVHHYPEEPDIDWRAPVLSQRRDWYTSRRYSKVCLAQKPVYWHNGFHGAYNVPAALPTSHLLSCLHLHQADYATTLRRHQRNAGRLWSPAFRTSPLAVHQRLDNPEQLQRYLLCDLDKPDSYAVLAPIPAAMKAREWQPV